MNDHGDQAESDANLIRSSSLWQSVTLRCKHSRVSVIPDLPRLRKEPQMVGAGLCRKRNLPNKAGRIAALDVVIQLAGVLAGIFGWKSGTGNLISRWSEIRHHDDANNPTESGTSPSPKGHLARASQLCQDRLAQMWGCMLRVSANQACMLKSAQPPLVEPPSSPAGRLRYPLLLEEQEM